jgi:microcystin-dependent protein
MATKSRRAYKGAAISNTLSSPLNNTTDFTISLSADMSGFDTSGTPFFCVIDPGTSKEEKVCVIYTSARVLTCVDPAVTSGWSASVDGRGVDDTVKQSHIAGAVIYPVFTAYEANEANELVSKYASTGAMVYQDASSFATLALGTSGYPLLAGASAPAYGQVTATGIADNAVTSAKIAANTIVQGDVATALLKLVCPVGTISAYPGATAPTGWLLCTGVSTTGYTELIALVGATTPDLQGKVLVGKGTAPFDGALLSSFGSTTSTAPHTHSGSTLTAVSGGVHDHTFSGTVNAESQDHVHAPLVIGFSLAAGATSVVATGPGGGADASYNTAGKSTTHNHTFSGTTSSHTGHAHTISGDTGASSASATHGNVQPSTIINYIIKHDYV